MLFAVLGYGQQTHHQTLYWLRYQNQLIFSPKLYWNNEADNRRFINPDVENQLIFHSRLHYKTGRWDFATGLTYSLAYAAIPENGHQSSTEEIRPVAEASYEIPIGKVFLQQRVRLDNRFFQEDVDKSVFEESFFVQRYRYRFQLRANLKVNEDKVVLWGVRVADEIMFNHTGNAFDQNRIYVTFERYLNAHFSLEAGYLYIYQQRFNRDEYFARNVMRFSVLHRVRWK